MSVLGNMVIYDLLANLPAPGVPGRLFCVSSGNQRGVTYRDNGASWDIWGSYLGAGITASRPVVDSAGPMYFDTTLTLPIWWTGVNWIKADGTVV